MTMASAKATATNLKERFMNALLLLSGTWIISGHVKEPSSSRHDKVVKSA
jgi:hypothetical protein